MFFEIPQSAGGVHARPRCQARDWVSDTVVEKHCVLEDNSCLDDIVWYSDLCCTSWECWFSFDHWSVLFTKIYWLCFPSSLGFYIIWKYVRNDGKFALTLEDEMIEDTQVCIDSQCILIFGWLRPLHSWVVFAIVEVRSQIPEFDCVNPSILDG